MTPSGTRRPLPPPYGTVVFDCDSTLARIEGVEELGRLRGIDLHALTEAAMNGEVPLQEVYGARLAAVRPTAREIGALGERYLAELLPNVRQLIAALAFLDKRVCIVSGGLLEPLLHLARGIGVAPEHVSGVATFHDEQGRYAGFDAASPLTRTGGKLAVLRALVEGGEAGAGGGGPLALVGDGVTDLEAAPACARFIAFGGVERREAVFADADVTCSEPDFAALLPLLCDEAEIGRLAADPGHEPLVTRARSL